MAFRDIKEQDQAIDFFRSSINKNRLSHAYLFLGPEGVGKSLLAKNLAKFLNCENPITNGDLNIDCCDSCISCHKINDFNHPDVHWVEAGRFKKISIDEIRSIQKEISLTTYEGRFKVFIIEDVQNLTEQAANSILKTLEEPPFSTVLILTTTDKSDLLPTIVSRCQIVKFYPLEYEKIKMILMDDYGFKPGNAHFLSVASEGRLGVALTLKEKDALNKKNYLIERILGGASFEIFNIKDKRELSVEIGYILNWFRDILVFKSGMPTHNIINIDRIETIKSQANTFNFQELEEVVTRIDEAYRLIEQNINPKIALEVMLTEISKCKR